MKKILVAVAVVIAAMSVGCSKTAEQVNREDKSLKEKIESTTDADSIAMYINEAKAYADSLAKAGQGEEAKKFMDELAPVVSEKSPSLKEQWDSAVSAVETTVASAADSVSSKVTEAGDSVVSKVSDAAEAAKDKAESVKDAAKDKAESAKEAVKTGYDAAKDGVEKASNDVANGAKDAFNGAKNAVNSLKK